MADVVAMLLAGGQGQRLSVLSQRRAKPAVPFGATYRIIDFTLSNVMHSQIPVVGVLTQYKPHSLSEHIGHGEWWGFTGRERQARILPPYQGNDDSDWYAGTADAIHQNRDFINRHNPDLILILSGDHIYGMDYQELIATHRTSNADLTIAMQRVPWEETSRFGVADVAEDGRIRSFQEKPKKDPVSNLASLGIYVFDAEKLLRRLAEDAQDRDSEHDFGKNIIPAMLAQDRVYSHEFSGYWRDVGTLESFWQANMDCLDAQSGLDLAGWQLRTNWFEYDPGLYMPMAISKGATAARSLISRGCQVRGKVERSILFPGVEVEEGAIVSDSILLPGVRVGAGSVLKRVICDKLTSFDRECHVGGDSAAHLPANVRFPHLLDTGLTVVGERCALPRGTKIGRNVLTFPGVSARDLHSNHVADGETLERKAS